MNRIRRHVEQGFQRFHVLVVLAQGVLEHVGLAIELLCPLRLAFTAEDPARHVFGLDDEDAVAGNQNMIDLGGAVGCGKRDIVNAAISLRGQP